MITDRLSARDVTCEDIDELIRTKQCELNELEFKREADSDITKAACAIANFGGGYILVGVAEDQQHCAHALVTVAQVQGASDRIRQTLRDGITPRPVIEVVPIQCSGFDIIVIRIGPQNPPHMISADKKTDFYGRYDATSERMRYDEIEQRFREKIVVAPISSAESPKAYIESVGGRIAVSEGAKGALERYVDEILAKDNALLGLIAVDDEISEAMIETDAVKCFNFPTYYRESGWLIGHPGFPVDTRSGLWLQRYDPFSDTYINSSGDLIFHKPVDEVLCWTQGQSEFERGPRFYPNALVEYCLSFCYLLADIAAVTRPKRILAQVVLLKAAGAILPLGEGGSVWFDAPIEPPHRLSESRLMSPVIELKDTDTSPICVRRHAFALASQIYAFFGYRERDVPFSANGQATFNSDSDLAKLAVIQSYLQGAFSSRVESRTEDFERNVVWFAMKGHPRKLRIGVSRELIEDVGGDEDAAYRLLDSFGILGRVRSVIDPTAFLITPEGIAPIEPTG